MKKPGKVVFFDGLCNLCHGVVQFLIQRDPERVFRYASLQSPFAEKVLDRKFTLDVNSMVFFEDGGQYQKSEAVIRIARYLPWPWRFFGYFGFVPLVLRDFIYDRVAASRYRVFGKKDSCPIPTAEQRALFVDNLD